MILTADRIITPGRTLAPGWVRVESGRVAEVGDGGPPTSDAHHLGATLAP